MARITLLSAVAAGLLAGHAAASVAAETYTQKHEAGRCAIRGQCGSKSWFGKQLPCPDNELAEEPDEALRKSLVDLCGPKWNTGAVCCTAEQVCDHPHLRRSRLRPGPSPLTMTSLAR
jgi:Niemann-Pick C1 protein